VNVTPIGAPVLHDFTCVIISNVLDNLLGFLLFLCFSLAPQFVLRYLGRKSVGR
jgi:hypothetical protein